MIKNTENYLKKRCQGDFSGRLSCFSVGLKALKRVRDNLRTRVGGYLYNTINYRLYQYSF
jgi:hypothetical protein